MAKSKQTEAQKEIARAKAKKNSLSTRKKRVQEAHEIVEADDLAAMNAAFWKPGGTGQDILDVARERNVAMSYARAEKIIREEDEAAFKKRDSERVKIPKANANPRNRRFKSPQNPVDSYIADFLTEGVNITPHDINLEQDGFEAFEMLGTYRNKQRAGQAVDQLEELAKIPELLPQMNVGGR